MRLATLLLSALSMASFLAPAAAAERKLAVGVIDIGNIRPEGIHILPEGIPPALGLGDTGTYALVTQLFYGGVIAVDVDTGDITSIVDTLAYGERGMIGLWYDSGAILVAGAGPILPEFANVTSSLHVFDAASGELRASCSPDGTAIFINDVTAIDGIAYVTDSLVNSILTVDVEAALGGECITSTIPLPEDPFLSADGSVQANGIIPYANGLLICTTTGGGLYYLDLVDSIVSEVLPPGTIVFSDGLAIDTDGILYVAENAENRVSVWQMSTNEENVTATAVGLIVSPDYDDPATCDFAGDILYCVNARFNTVQFPSPGEDDPDTFPERFQMVGVDRLDFVTEAPTTLPLPTMPPATMENETATVAPSMMPTMPPTTMENETATVAPSMMPTMPPTMQATTESPLPSGAFLAYKGVIIFFIFGVMSFWMLI